MTRITEEKTNRQERTTDRNPRDERKKRVPLGTLRAKLHAEPKEGYHRRWINDVPGRLQQALDGGYRFVSREGEDTGDYIKMGGGDLGKFRSEIVGVHQSGEPMRAYLMEIKQEWRDEDVAEKLEAAYSIDEQIRSGTVGNDSGEIGHEHRYIPNEGIKYNT